MFSGGSGGFSLNHGAIQKAMKSAPSSAAASGPAAAAGSAAGDAAAADGAAANDGGEPDELLSAVRENGSFEPFMYKCDLFTKTGSGQT